MKLSPTSLERLNGVHPDLVKVVKQAAQDTTLDFIITEGVRTVKKQETLVAVGASQTMKSRHLTGHAVDLAAVVDGQVRWDWPLYDKLGILMKASAAKVGVPIIWGGDWRTLKDGPHFELTRKEYP